MRNHDNLASRSSRLRNGLVIAAIVLLVLVATGYILAAHYWPFTESRVAKGLEETVTGKAQIAAFHRTYFPSLGCVAEGVAITGSDAQSGPVLIMVQKLTVRTGFMDLFRNSIQEVHAEGLRVIVPPGTGLNPRIGRSQSGSSNRVVRKFVADGAVVEFRRAPRSQETPPEPLRFDISRLTLLQRGQDSPIAFQTVLVNPEPPGEITAEGEFGPWKADDPGSTAVSGSYTFSDARLDVFKGIAGTLSSEGKFGGNLKHVEVEGTTQTPGFELKHARHRVRLNTRFSAIVDGINGDTLLQSLEVRLQDTSIASRVSVEEQRGSEGKLTTVSANGKGRVQDLLVLFSEDRPPAMSGTISFKARATFPTGHEPFLKKLSVVGDFSIDDVRFSKATTQASFEELSARAQGHKLKKPGDAPAVSADLTGHVVLRGGIATFSDLTFRAPGASAQLSGTYSLLNYRVNLQGTLETKASLSRSATGIKAVLLKPLDPVFKRKPAGAAVGVKLGGTYDQPSFGIDLDAHKPSHPPLPAGTTAH